MSKQENGFSRRQILAMALGASSPTLWRATPSILTQPPPARVFTPSIILGPFYPQIKPSSPAALRLN
ncbi:MAG TPA: hypothetical protein VIK76_11470 [Pyrinomonadaceae bacterium]|jgi:hypothetical protein